MRGFGRLLIAACMVIVAGPAGLADDTRPFVEDGEVDQQINLSRHSPFETVWESEPGEPLPGACEDLAPCDPPVDEGETLAPPPSRPRQPLWPLRGSETIELPPLGPEWRGHGPFGLYSDPKSTDAERPDYCDEADVGPNTPWDKSLTRWWTRDLSIFGGVHGFKGPADQGRNGNFGFHEGFNFGAPLGLFDWGWQVGAEEVHSNLSGDQAVDPRSSNRNQTFVTVGIFRRARDWGCQWGVTYDWLHDEYYVKSNLKQIRSDSSFIFPGRVHEVGYFGAYGTGGGDTVLLDRQVKYFIYQEPTDIFAFYYRRYFSGGGDGRLWLGWSGRGDGLFGAELRVPMGTSWALENRMNYLIPKQGNGAGAALQESWGVTIDLVWYPGHPSRCERWHPYRPMLNVADNTLFMTDTFVP